MKLFSTLAPLASFGLTAAGMPIAGAAAGGIFGALSAQQMRDEQMRQRQAEMLANAESNRYSWARKSGQSPQVDVQPWMGEGVSLGAGAVKGLEQASEFQKLFQKDKEGVQVYEKPTVFQQQVSGSSPARKSELSVVEQPIDMSFSIDALQAANQTTKNTGNKRVPQSLEPTYEEQDPRILGLNKYILANAAKNMGKGRQTPLAYQTLY